MKRLTPYLAILFLVIIMGFDIEPVYYGEYRPIFMHRNNLENNVQLIGPESILEPGKIYLKDNLIFINEKYRGIHVIDNTNPEDPTNFAFINIDGCIDISMKENVLYADNAVDLIAIRLNPDLTDIEVTKRIKNVFPELLSPDGRNLNWEEEQAKPDGAILVRWTKDL